MYYDPADPMNARLAEDMRSMYPLLSGAFGAFFLGMGLLELRKVRRDHVRKFLFGADEDGDRARAGPGGDDDGSDPP
jgi:hypothetical protein